MLKQLKPGLHKVARKNRRSARTGNHPEAGK